METEKTTVRFGSILKTLGFMGILLSFLLGGYTFLRAENTSRTERETTSEEIWLTGRESAFLCNNCGFGNKKNDCVKCGKWIGGGGSPAHLCNSCGFGSKKNDCVKCGKWTGSARIPAQLCNSCSFGNKKNNCVKCGKWTP